MTEISTEKNQSLTEETYEGFTVKKSHIINSKLKVTIYADSNGDRFVGLEHYALKDQEVKEILITESTMKKVISKLLF